jgi:hypothetical protein
LPYNGSGTFTPAVTFTDGTTATAEDQNTQDVDIASGLTQCQTRAGLAPATANWNMGGNKLVSLSNGSAPGDSVAFGQISPLLSIGADTVLGNATGGAALPVPLSQTQLTALINAFTGSLSGAVPASSGGALTYLRADGAFASPFGFDVPINMGISASVATNALTINLTTAAGTTPSASSPVIIPFRSTTITSGAPILAQVSSALSIVIPSTATLGTSSSNVPFRIWVFICYNGGTPELGVAVCSTPTGTIFPAAAWETTLKTTITIGTGATSSGVLYSTAGVVSDSVRIIGYAEYGSGLGTAGAWASGPTALQLMGPGVKKPGDIVQTVVSNFGTLSVTTFTSLASTNITLAITPTSSANLIKYFATSTHGSSSASAICLPQMYRGSTAIGNISRTSATSSGGETVGWPFVVQGYDAPGSTSAQTYVVKATESGGTGSIPDTNTDSASEILEEIMG